MFFDFCIGEHGASGAPCGLDTIYLVWGDESYRTPRKAITPGKTYIVFTLKGAGRIQYDGQTYDVSENELLAMRPHSDFSYFCEGSVWRFWWFELTQPQQYVPEDCVLKCGAPSGFVLDLFKHSLVSAKQGRWDIAQGLVLSSLMVIMDQRARGALQPGGALIERAQQYVRENLSSATVASMCEELSVQERTLRNICHKVLGISPKQMISRMRIEMAQQLFVNTGMPLMDISIQLGFASQYHFSRSFKEQVGLSPSEYRRQNAY